MATFRVTVSKTLYGTVLIEAENAYEALNKANELTIDDDDDVQEDSENQFIEWEPAESVVDVFESDEDPVWALNHEWEDDFDEQETDTE